MPTVTDAHIVLGHLPPSLLGGSMRLDPAAAATAIADHVATPLGLDLHAAARGILAIADNNMVGAIRIVSVERGHDPRSFALVPFGGAGPLHGCALADILGITTVLVPPAPGVLCAEGLLAADLKAEWSRKLPTAGVVSEDEASAILLALHAEATSWLEAEKVPPQHRSTEEVALLRYAGQGGELSVPWGGSVGAAQAGFVAAHQTQYGFVLTAAVELVTLRVEATRALPDAVMPLLSPGDLPAPLHTLPVHFVGGTVDTPLYDRAALPADVRLTGPAILLQLDATTLIPPGWHAEVHRSAAIILRRSPQTIGETT